MIDFPLSRRMLLKAGLAGVSSIALGGGLLVPCGPARAGAAGTYVSLTTGRTLHGKPTTCGLCPAGCGILGFSNERGDLEGLAGNPGHPVNRGAVCALGSSAMNLIGSPLRVSTPLRRVGDRGAGAWESVSWDRALAELAEALKTSLKREGRAAGPAVCVPERRLSCFLDRFVSFFPAGCLGVADGYELAVERAAHRAFSGSAVRGLADLENAELVLNFGADPLGSVRQLLGAARSWSEGWRAGARWITLDPRLSETAAACGRWIPIRPGTDGAFASAVAAWILENGRQDGAFLRGLPAGEEARIRETLAPWSPKRAAGVCGVSAGTIREVAREFSRAGRAVAIFGSGVTAREDGERDARAILLLNFLTDNVDRQGGYRLVAEQAWQQPDPQPSRAGGPVLPGTLFRELERGRPSVDTLITWEANPAVTDPGGASTAEVLKNRQRVLFHVALASVWNETVHLADLVLPAATFLEEWGLFQGVCPGDGSRWAGLRQPVFRSGGDARPAEAVLLEAVRMVGEQARAAFPFPDMERYYRAVLAENLAGEDSALRRERLHEHGFLLRPVTPGQGNGTGGHRASGDGHAPEAGGFCPVVTVDASSRGEAPAGPVEERGPGGFGNRGQGPPGGGTEKTLLLFGSPLQGPDAARLKWVEELEHNRPLWMHPAAAREAGCSEGDWVRVRGPAGEIRTRVRLTQGLHPDAVAMRSAGAGMDGPAGPPAPLPPGLPSDPDRVWWTGGVYGENVRKVVPWPRDPGQTCPGWQDTRVTIVREPS